jgi:hypothetical protein
MWHSSAFLRPFLQWKCNRYYVIWVHVCRLSYPACNANAPYCHLWPVRLYNIFLHYLINGTSFGKTLLNIKCVFWFSLQLSSETFLILRRTERDKIKNAYCYSRKVFNILVGFQWKLNFFWQIFEKHSHFKFHYNLSSGNRDFSRGRTGVEADSRMLQLGECT